MLLDMRQFAKRRCATALMQLQGRMKAAKRHAHQALIVAALTDITTLAKAALCS
jgi:hypothetical protein